jgi:hypothetical protein
MPHISIGSKSNRALSPMPAGKAIFFPSSEGRTCYESGVYREKAFCVIHCVKMNSLKRVQFNIIVWGMRRMLQSNYRCCQTYRFLRIGPLKQSVNYRRHAGRVLGLNWNNDFCRGSRRVQLNVCTLCNKLAEILYQSLCVA